MRRREGGCSRLVGLPVLCFGMLVLGRCIWLIKGCRYRRILLFHINQKIINSAIAKFFDFVSGYCVVGFFFYVFAEGFAEGCSVFYAGVLWCVRYVLLRNEMNT